LATPSDVKKEVLRSRKSRSRSLFMGACLS
jgi:hypothetical protein